MKTTLIVEDDKPMARAIQLKLTDVGVESVVAYDGREALEVLKEQQIDLILLDILMPKMNGLKFLEELAKRNISIPVIVISNLSHEDDVKEAKRLGAMEYFVKADITLNQVVDKVTKVLDVQPVL